MSFLHGNPGPQNIIFEQCLRPLLAQVRYVDVGGCLVKNMPPILQNAIAAKRLRAQAQCDEAWSKS